MLTIHQAILDHFRSSRESTTRLLEESSSSWCVDEDEKEDDDPFRKRRDGLREILDRLNRDEKWYLVQTGLMIQRYMVLLKRPMTTENETSMKDEKMELFRPYLLVAKETIKLHNWSDISLEIPGFPSPSYQVVGDKKIKKKGKDQKTPSCVYCHNQDADLFDSDVFNRKFCLLCSCQQDVMEIGITHIDYNRVNVINKFVYNRTVHFQDCIKQFQGKQNCNLPAKLMKDLHEKFINYNLLLDSPLEHVRHCRVTREHILKFLKELHYIKHYENVNLIYYILTNQRHDICHLEADIIRDFKQLVSLYDRLYGGKKGEEATDSRKNFLNVQYVLYQLLKRHQYPCKSTDFTTLKTVDRKLFHDRICSNLFDKLGWNFVPTF